MQKLVFPWRSSNMKSSTGSSSLWKQLLLNYYFKCSFGVYICISLIITLNIWSILECYSATIAFLLHNAVWKHLINNFLMNVLCARRWGYAVMCILCKWCPYFMALTEIVYPSPTINYVKVLGFPPPDAFAFCFLITQSPVNRRGYDTKREWKWTIAGDCQSVAPARYALISFHQGHTQELLPFDHFPAIKRYDIRTYELICLATRKSDIFANFVMLLLFLVWDWL